MKFNLKLLVITFVLSVGSAYAAEQKEDFDNKDFQSFFDEKSREYRADFESKGWDLNVIERTILRMKPKWYKEWKSQIATNLEESLFYLIGQHDYIFKVFKPEFDQNIEELIKNKADINNNKYTDGQTLMMKILKIISELASRNFGIAKFSIIKRKTKTGGYLIEKHQKVISKCNDVLKKVLPNVNDFYVEDDSGKTVFDYAKDNEEITKLLKSALEKRKQEIRRSLQHHLIPELQSIVCDY